MQSSWLREFITIATWLVIRGSKMANFSKSSTHYLNAPLHLVRITSTNLPSITTSKVTYTITRVTKTKCKSFIVHCHWVNSWMRNSKKLKNQPKIRTLQSVKFWRNLRSRARSTFQRQHKRMLLQYSTSKAIRLKQICWVSPYARTVIILCHP